MAQQLNKHSATTSDSVTAPPPRRIPIANWLLAALILALIAWWFYGKPWQQVLQSLTNVLLLLGGLTLVIFVHELGHFLAAKWCDVHVETFSIGFGSPIPGLWFRKGETLYKVAWIPLGGYVKMLGELPGEESDPEILNNPRAYQNKPVGQRMLIISAGVIMNLVLGAGCFIYAYMAGKSEVLPLVGYVEPGSRADQAGLEPGSLVLQVNRNERPAFEDLMFASATARADVTQIYLRWQTPNGVVRDAYIAPRRLPHDQRPLLGLGPMPGLSLIRMEVDNDGPVAPDSPAANRGFRPGDVLLGVRSVGQGFEYRLLSREEYQSGQAEPRIRGLRQLSRALYQLREQPVAFHVWRPETDEEHWLEVPPNPVRWLGLTLELGAIVSINPITERACQSDARLQVGDVITAINGQAIGDPFRLPERLEALAGQTVSLTVRRGDRELKIPVRPLADAPSWWEYPPSRPLAPWAIPALGITCRIEPVLVADLDTERFPARDAESQQPVRLPAGTRFTHIELQDRSMRNPGTWRTISYRFGEDETAADVVAWPYIFWSLQSTLVSAEVILSVQIPSEDGPVTQRVRLSARSMSDWFNPDRGLMRDREKLVYYAPDPFQAIYLGLRDTHRTVVNIYLTLKNLFTGDISIRLLSGPIGIAEMGYGMASLGFNYFVWFIGVISINLAVINFLPIPILDGGHMLFLLIEKIRGRPVSRRVLEYASIVGLMLILLLLILATTMDITRFLSR
ncbi:MAG: site-2 protease family protein [Gemmatales bacterium]|nr:site-2 protease family protein [Gemmatales bacterium]MDW8174812.1 site-2 protease family protein [Gemmatales bacterium]